MGLVPAQRQEELGQASHQGFLGLVPFGNAMAREVLLLRETARTPGAGQRKELSSRNWAGPSVPSDPLASSQQSMKNWPRCRARRLR